MHTAFGKNHAQPGNVAKTIWPWLVSQGSFRRDHNGITSNHGAIDRGLPNRQIASHQDPAAQSAEPKEDRIISEANEELCK
jgi:hypothetical protein